MNKRPHYLFVCLFSVALLGAALFVQLVMGLEPCPLCILQRMALITIGVVGLVAFLHNPAWLGDKVYGLLLMLGGLCSAGIAIRQVWLLSLPAEEAASCGRVSKSGWIVLLPIYRKGRQRKYCCVVGRVARMLRGHCWA